MWDKKQEVMLTLCLVAPGPGNDAEDFFISSRYMSQKSRRKMKCGGQPVHWPTLRTHAKSSFSSRAMNHGVLYIWKLVSAIGPGFGFVRGRSSRNYRAFSVKYFFFSKEGGGKFWLLMCSLWFDSALFTLDTSIFFFPLGCSLLTQSTEMALLEPLQFIVLAQLKTLQHTMCHALSSYQLMFPNQD